MNLHNSSYSLLKDNISFLLSEGRIQAGQAVNTILLKTYWNIGRYIVEYEQGGADRASYGKGLISRLANDLTLEFGKGFSRSNLKSMRMLFMQFEKSQTLSDFLSWSHYLEIMKEEDELERSFYIKQCEQEKWSVRELKRQMKSMLFHRIALSKDKQGVIKMAKDGAKIQTPSDLLRDPYIFEFCYGVYN